MKEVEAKLLIEGKDRERIKHELLSLRSVGSFLLRKPAQSVLKIFDVYYDTPTHDLQRSSMSLRLRKEDVTTKITFKRKRAHADALHDREELEGQVDARLLESILHVLAGVGILSADLVQPAVQRTADDPQEALRMCGLSPTAVVSNTRHVREVTADGDPVALLCVDDVLLQSDDHTKCELEIEIEARSPSRSEVVLELAERLATRYPGRIAYTKLSKYERALSSGPEGDD
jgi:inorganic triphosphatase YgiF